MTDSKISWATKSYNPIRGCDPISPGCDNCYASRMAHRFMNPKSPWKGLVDEETAEWNGRVVFDEKSLDLPRRWRKPQRIFVCSMSDLFSKKVPDSWIRRVFSVMIANAHHTYLVLTKRANRMKNFLTMHEGDQYKHWPHIWLGVTAENQAYANYRIRKLIQVPAVNRFVSVEPMLGPIDMEPELDSGKIHWVVCGGESGAGHRKMEEAWALDLMDQCESTRVPFHFKQHSGPRPGWKPELDGVEHRWVPPLPGER